MDDSQRGSLGIVAQDVSQEALEIYEIPAGAFVYEVFDGSAAEEAGIERGDIITQFDGTPIDSSSALENLLDYYAAGEEVEIVFQTSREGAYQEMTATAVLQEAEDGSTDPEMPGPYYGDPGYNSWYDFMW